MKIITLINGKEKVVTDEFFGEIEQKLQNTFIRLEDGSLINTKSIADISDPEPSPYFQGVPLDKKAQYYIWEGKRVYLSSSQQREINWIVPKFYKEQEEMFIKENNKKLLK